MAIPKTNRLVWPTVQAVRNLGGSARNQEITDEVSKILSLSEEEINKPQKGHNMTLLEYRLAWARTSLKKRGLLVNSSRGVWSLTPLSEGLGKANFDEIHAQVLEEYKEKQTRKYGRAAQNTSESQAPEAVAETDDGVDAEGDWKDSLLGALTEMPPDAFERLCKRLFRESGFESVEVTGQPGDGGIDGVGTLRVNLVTFQVVFQCKRYKSSVASSAVRDFRGAMVGRGEKGLVITTGSFTREARKESVRPGAPSIDLVDGDRLCDLLKNLGLGVSTEMVERVNIDREWFLRV